MTDFPRRILPRWQNASAVMTGISEATLAARGLARIAAPVLWRPVRPIPEQAHVALVRALVVDHVGAPTAAASAAAILRQRQKRFALPFPTGIISALTSRSAPPVGLRIALALERARRTSGDRIAATTEPGRGITSPQRKRDESLRAGKNCQRPMTVHRLGLRLFANWRKVSTTISLDRTVDEKIEHRRRA